MMALRWLPGRIAAMILTTNALITDAPEKNPAVAASTNWGGDCR